MCAHTHARHTYKSRTLTYTLTHTPHCLQEVEEEEKEEEDANFHEVEMKVVVDPVTLR